MHYACTFHNDSPDTLIFGESANTDEMCILSGNFYPIPDGLTTVICQ